MICWLDLETTGLSENVGHILEVAVAITDDDLVEQDRFHTVVRPPQWDELDVRELIPDDIVFDMHTQNGLIAELDADHGVNLRTAERLVRDLLHRWAPPAPGQIQWGGTGVERFDSRWLELYMPEVFARFTYGALDLGSTRRLFRLFGLDWELPGEKAHRAMADVERSILEARHWRGYLTRLHASPPA